MTLSEKIKREYSADEIAILEGVIDYADMISGCEALLREHPEVLASVLGEIDCVIIDEFQDTNPVQFALLWQLGQHAPRTLLDRKSVV